jgi:hypothetical protein
VGDGPLTSGIARARDLRAVRAASVNSEPIGLGRISNSSGVSAHPATHPGEQQEALSLPVSPPSVPVAYCFCACYPPLPGSSSLHVAAGCM